ncbi:hypothetical protein ES692_15585 [Psychroserpens burtonensis]|uniref:Endonuclease/exonuclease/phosphatase domain-containing protein n=1 Tax=Psychroserpens burtonensis TaxID=49278 RepID=A0A5C7B5K5_9FLAO|nr:hypothetical protein [Psychroserpens burtonensis]TXE15699.1 hypothetical protein ES692_15585 [Psychroserpens burtonensis]
MLLACQSIKFKPKKSDHTFHVVNFHSRTHSDQPELEIELFKDYHQRLNTDHILIAGDFNINERHNIWDGFYQQGYKSAVKSSKTTLKRKCSSGDYLSHSIDNIYYSKRIKLFNSGVVDYVETCKNLLAARKISDHLPVFLEFSITDN